MGPVFTWGIILSSPPITDGAIAHGDGPTTDTDGAMDMAPTGMDMAVDITDMADTMVLLTMVVLITMYLLKNTNMVPAIIMNVFMEVPDQAGLLPSKNQG